ncbi:MAG TPA: polymer-forming cytoskeletal protein [Bacteroidota bacterium]|nr:polymer-forming cytoskeletal protein [Bacteroidota bacterium]
MGNKVDTGSEMNLVGAGTVFEGKLRTPGSIRIEGKVIGDVVATQNMVIGVAGEIEGTITAKSITVGGKVRGTIIAYEKLVFESKAVVKGDIRASKLVIDEGAMFDGKSVMAEAKPTASVVELKPELRRAENAG